MIITDPTILRFIAGYCLPSHSLMCSFLVIRGHAVIGGSVAWERTREHRLIQTVGWFYSSGYSAWHIGCVRCVSCCSTCCCLPSDCEVISVAIHTPAASPMCRLMVSVILRHLWCMSSPNDQPDNPPQSNPQREGTTFISALSILLAVSFLVHWGPPSPGWKWITRLFSDCFI